MSPARQRIGIIGAGVSGIAAAWMLERDHDVTLLEKENRFGGHAESVAVSANGQTVYAEIGPRFFFDPSYPYFLGLLRLLGVETRWNPALVSITDLREHYTLVLPPRLPRHVVSLLRSPSRLRHVLSLRRLTNEQASVFKRRDYAVPFHRYLEEGRYPDRFGPEFAYPFLAACWGSPIPSILDFPAYSLLKGMPPGDKAGFFEIVNGMSSYMTTFGARLTRTDVRLGTGVAAIQRPDDTFVVTDERGREHHFDQLIVATGSKDATALLAGIPAVAEMHAAVAGFRHFETRIVVHGDPSLMPPNRKDWAHINLFFEGDHSWMSDFPGLRSGAPVFRTWLPKGRPLPSPLYASRTFHHLLMTPENAILQRRIATMQGHAGLWVTGMYAADIDNHESALLSAVVPVKGLAPESENLAQLLGAVAPDAGHGLDVLPVPYESGRSEGGRAPSVRDASQEPRV